MNDNDAWDLLECAPEMHDSSYQQVEYACQVCGHVSEVSDAFTSVCCPKCGHVGRRPALLDPRLYVNMLEEIRQGIPCQFHYHNWEHARDTVEAVYRIIRHYPKLAIWKKRSLLIAALLHDYGFSVSRENHEAESAKFAERTCLGCGYSRRETELVERLILATHKGYTPRTLEEKIIRDADLFHIGTARQEECACRLRRELAEFGRCFSDEDWNNMNIAFSHEHRFHQKWMNSRKKEK